jgi:hypothetical protein
MKKFLYISIALFAFVVGILGIYLKPLFVPVPLSELKGKLYLYKSREIKVKGYFTSSKFRSTKWEFIYIILENAKCDEYGYCVSAAISLELSEETKEKESVLIQELAEKNYQYELEKKEAVEGNYGVEVEITGQIEERETNFSGIDPFVIKVKEIKQTSPIKFITIRKVTDKK